MNDRKPSFAQAEFVVSAAAARGFLTDRPGILFTGRSNAGKSTLINALTFRRNLMKTSAAPGKTRLVNYALIDSAFYLVDAPGYGFERNRDYFATLMDSYFAVCAKTTRALVLVLDSRRGIMASDELLERFAAANSIPLVFVFTKTDKLSRQDLLLLQRRMAQSRPGLKAFYVNRKDEAALQQVRDCLAGLARRKAGA